eukprot:5465884-Ditylum_brightwellii.AAC.1
MAWNSVTTTKIPLLMMTLSWTQTTPNSQEWTCQATVTESAVVKRTAMEITAMAKTRAAVAETKMTLSTAAVIAVGATTMTVLVMTTVETKLLRTMMIAVERTLAMKMYVQPSTSLA